MDNLVCIIYIITAGLRLVLAVSVTQIIVPELADFRDNVTLVCSYDTSGTTLNSVKWYKDSAEFFRYRPGVHPIYSKFPVAGVQVQDGRYFCDDTACRVEVRLEGARSTDIYKCEVSGEAPQFRLAAKAVKMTVEAFPQNNPLIQDFKSAYHVDDFLSASCISDYSSLPTRLSWYINGEQPLSGEVQPSVDETVLAHDYVLRRKRMLVHFYLRSERFYHTNKRIELRCVADIENYPELRRETAMTASISRQEFEIDNQVLAHLANGASSSAVLLPSTIQWFWLYSFLVLCKLMAP